MSDLLTALLRPQSVFLVAGFLLVGLCGKAVESYSVYLRPDVPPEGHATLRHALYFGLAALWCFWWASRP